MLGEKCLFTPIDAVLSLRPSAAPKSAIDELLEQLQDLVDTYLPIIGPLIGLTIKETLQVINLFDKFVADVEALEHGQVPVTEGLEAMVDDILDILIILGVDWTAPSKCSEHSS